LIKGISFQGFLDTGADQSVILQSLWPKHWGTKRETTIQGVGESQLAKLVQRYSNGRMKKATQGLFNLS
jgi:hypothetical protein